jgi:hypothetical protein
VIGGRPPILEPMLHVHVDGIQVLAATAVEPHHLALRRCRREVDVKLIAERPILAPIGDERQRPQDSGIALPARAVVAVHARQHLVREV